MNTLVLEHGSLICEVSFTDDAFTVILDDGRSVSIPIVWCPRLLNANQRERGNYELIGEGEGIHWPDLDEDISVEGILAGRPSGESQESLAKWLRSRTQQAD